MTAYIPVPQSMLAEIEEDKAELQKEWARVIEAMQHVQQTTALVRYGLRSTQDCD